MTWFHWLLYQRPTLWWNHGRGSVENNKENVNPLCVSHYVSVYVFVGVRYPPPPLSPSLTPSPSLFILHLQLLLTLSLSLFPPSLHLSLFLSISNFLPLTLSLSPPPSLPPSLSPRTHSHSHGLAFHLNFFVTSAGHNFAKPVVFSCPNTVNLVKVWTQLLMMTWTSWRYEHNLHTTAVYKEEINCHPNCYQYDPRKRKCARCESAENGVFQHLTSFSCRNVE